MTSHDDDDKTPPLGAPSIPPSKRAPRAPSKVAARRVAPVPSKPPSPDARALSSRVRAPSPAPVSPERTRIEAPPVGMEFAEEEEPLTMLDARVAIGLPIEREEGGAQKPLPSRSKPAVEPEALPVARTSASRSGGSSSAAAKPSVSSSERGRGADADFLAKIGQRAPDSVDPTPPSSPAVVLPKVSPAAPAVSAPDKLGVAAKLTEAAKAKAARFRRPKMEGGDSTPGWLGAIALREYILFSALILTFIAASFLTKREQEVSVVRLRPKEATRPERPKSWQQLLRETAPPPPPPEFAAPLPPPEPLPPPAELPPPPAPPETSKAGAGRRLAMRFLTVASTPKGASVTVNGMNRGRTPFIESSMKELSKVDVEVTMEGYKTWRGTVEPNPAGHIMVNAKLEKE